MSTKNYTKSKVMITETHTYKLWESAGRKLVEAQLTPDQIQQIFQGAQDIETGGDNNRTMIGKGKDAATAVGQAWENLKTKAQTSKPIDGFEKKYDAVARRLKQATGGDQGAMKYIQYYRDFAKKHPIAQGVIYAALIAAVGLSGAGVGGAAALGLFKMTDKLLQGDKFTSAAWSGAKTGALAYGASQLAQYFQNPKVPLPDTIDSVKLPNGTDYVVKQGDTLSQIAQKYGVSVEELMKANNGATTVTPTGQSMTWNNPNALSDVNPMGDAVPSGTGVQQDYDVRTAPKVANPDRINVGQKLNIPGATGSSPYQGGVGTAGDTWNKIGAGKYPYDQISANQARKFGVMKESVNLTESQIFLLIGKIVERHNRIDEGIMDTIKGAAGKTAAWARTKGQNLTTKITADKLLQAWKKAQSPTDSDAVAKVMINAGVPQETVDNLMKNFIQGPSAGTNTNVWQGADRSVPAYQRKQQGQSFTATPDTQGQNSVSQPNTMANTPVSKTNTVKPNNPNLAPSGQTQPQSNAPTTNTTPIGQTQPQTSTGLPPGVNPEKVNAAQQAAGLPPVYKQTADGKWEETDQYKGSWKDAPMTGQWDQSNPEQSKDLSIPKQYKDSSFTSNMTAPMRTGRQSSASIAQANKGVNPLGGEVKQEIDQVVTKIKNVRQDRRPKLAMYGKERFDQLAQEVSPQTTQSTQEPAADNTIKIPKKTTPKKTTRTKINKVGTNESEFAGNYTTGVAGQWRNKGPKANKPATIGDLVGESEENKNNNKEDRFSKFMDKKSKEVGRVNNPKIKGTDNYAKSAYIPEPKPPLKRLATPYTNETVAEGLDDLARILHIAGLRK